MSALNKILKSQIAAEFTMQNDWTACFSECLNHHSYQSENVHRDEREFLRSQLYRHCTERICSEQTFEIFFLYHLRTRRTHTRHCRQLMKILKVSSIVMSRGKFSGK